jgi:hypothetical protein
MTLKELVENLQQLPQNMQDMEVWGFDYGDYQGYQISEVTAPDNYLELGVDYPVIMLR